MCALPTAQPQQVIVSLDASNGYQPWQQDSCDDTSCAKVPDDIIRGPVHNVLKVVCINSKIIKYLEFWTNVFVVSFNNEFFRYKLFIRVSNKTKIWGPINLRIDYC